MNKSNLFNSSDLGLRIIFLKQLLVDILPLGSVSVDPHIFEDPDPGSKSCGFQALQLGKITRLIIELGQISRNSMSVGNRGNSFLNYLKFVLLSLLYKSYV